MNRPNISRSIVKINAYTSNHQINPIKMCRGKEEAWSEAKTILYKARKSRYQKIILVIQSVGVRLVSNCNWTVKAA